jgi:putative hydrolase of the HAD superfamily
VPRIDAVFFDLGNVLVFHDDPILFQRMSEWGGASPQIIRERMLGLWDVINRGALAGDELRRRVCLAAGSEIPMEQAAFVEMWNSHFRVNEALVPLVESVLDQVQVFLTSNTNQTHFDYLRPKLPILERFTGLVLSYELGVAKPEAAFFEMALAKARVLAENTAFFDDIPQFVQAALGLGIMGRVYRDVDQFRSQIAELGLRV